MNFPGNGMSWKQFGIELKDEYKKDRIGDVAGSLTFFGVLALFPFVLFLVSVASVVIDPSQAESLINSLSKFAPEQVKTILVDRIRQLAADNNVGLLSVGAAGALWAASSGMVALSRALNIVYGVEESRGFIKLRLRAIGMTLVVGLLGVIAAALVVVVPSIASHLPSPFSFVVKLLAFPLAGAVMMLVWALVYYVLPDVEQKFKFISPGAVGGVVLWLIASFGFNLYVSNFGKYDATYGALGGVIVMLMWMWISSQVLLTGAEVNAIIEHASEEGKRPGAKAQNDTGMRPTPQYARAKEKGNPGHVETPARHPGRRPSQAPQRPIPSARQAAKRKEHPLKSLVVGVAAAFFAEKLTRKKQHA